MSDGHRHPGREDPAYWAEAVVAAKRICRDRATFDTIYRDRDRDRDRDHGRAWHGASGA